MAASIGTFVTYLAHKLQHKKWDYDINLVTWSAGLFYGYVTFVPLGLYIILKYFSAPSGLAQLWCLYGYSLFVFIPASVSNTFHNFSYRQSWFNLKNLFWHGSLGYWITSFFICWDWYCEILFALCLHLYNSAICRTV